MKKEFTVVNQSTNETVSFSSVLEVSQYVFSHIGDELKIVTTEIYDLYDSNNKLVKTITLESYSYIKGVI